MWRNGANLQANRVGRWHHGGRSRECTSRGEKADTIDEFYLARCEKRAAKQFEGRLAAQGEGERGDIYRIGSGQNK